MTLSSALVGVDTAARGRTPTAAAWASATGEGLVHVLHTASHVSGPNLPVDVDPKDLRRVQNFTAPEATLTELPYASAWGSDGVVITRDGCLVEDLVRCWGASPEDHEIWKQLPAVPMTLAGTVAVVAARGAANNFSHFVADTLPRIGLVRAAGVSVDKWLVSSIRHRWQRDALQLARVPADAVIALDEQRIVRSDNLLVPSPTGFAPTTAPWARTELRNLLGLSPDAALGTRRLVISRKSATRRRLRNEEALIEALKERDFKVVDLALLPFGDQLSVIGQAETIIGVHGAGLSHLLHMPSGGHLVEITQARHAHPEYWRLSSMAGWRHTFVRARSVTEQGGDLNDDLRVVVSDVIDRC